MTANAPPLADLSIPDLLRRFASEGALLVGDELALARIDLGEKGKKVRAASISFAIAAVLGVGAFGALTATLIAAIALAVPLWAAALIVTVVYLVIAAILGLQGKKTLDTASPLVPEQTLRNLKADAQAVRVGFTNGGR